MTPTPVHIVFNASAGAVLKAGREAIEKEITASGLEAIPHFCEAQDILSTLKKLKESGAPVLLGGGDGTLMRCAPLFMDAPGQLGLIPMGTMNLLANDLGLPIGLSEALNAYAGGTRRIAIDVGAVNGKNFLCCAALGVIPEASAFREENRGQPDVLLIPRVALFIFTRMDNRRRHFRVKLNGKSRPIRTPALIVSNNLLKEDAAPEEHAFQKDSLQDGLLGVYSFAPSTWIDKLRMLFRFRFGHWKQESALVERVAKTVEVRTHRRQEEVSLDGETQTLSMPLLFSVKRRALTLLVPKSAAAMKKPEAA